jgi:glycosyltransferase involved in cell wall biosynthesis
MRILLSCYYFSPYRGGEAAVGWKYATGLAKIGHDVTVLYGDLAAAEPMKADLDRFTAENKLPENLTAIHVRAGRMSRMIHNLHAKPGLFFLYYPAYRLWQKANFREAQRLHTANPFDLAHHVTIIGYREPGYLWKLGIPFFWGPINGAAMMPWGFIRSFGWRGRYQHCVRNVLNWIQMRLPSRSRKAAMAAAGIWAVTEEDRHMVENVWGLKADLMIETGATPSPDAHIKHRETSEPLRLVWCGICEARKSMNFIIDAMAGLPKDTPCRLDVIGDGPERERWQRDAAAKGLASMIHWHGRVPHADAQRLMADGHVLVHSSVKEGTPHVVLEALAGGLPVICHDACGMGVAVDASCGLKVPLKDPRTSISGFRNAIATLSHDPDLLTRLSEGAQRRARQLSWDGKIESIDRGYQRISPRVPSGNLRRTADPS